MENKPTVDLDSIPTVYEKHSEMVRSLAKSGNFIREQLTDHSTHMLHMAVGISGEVGELLESVVNSMSSPPTMNT